VSDLKPITVSVERYLSLNKYEVDEGSPHIELTDEPSAAEFLKLVRVCPAALYKTDAVGARSFDYAGCLECGTCRMACGDTIIESWGFPAPTMGVEYRYG
jgi:ferredoxin-like protein FixX